MAAIPWEELTKEEREAILAKVVEKEIAETHALGLPTTHGDCDGVYDLYPDGQKVYTKAKEKIA